MPAAEPLHTLRNVHRPVAVHHQDMIRNIEESPRASRNQDGGNTRFPVQIPRPLQKRRNGLLVPHDHLLHELIPNHEIGGRCILVDQKQPGSRLNAFHHGSRLGGGTAGILGGKFLRVFFIGQIIDKQGNIHIPDGPAVLRPQLQRRLLSDNEFPSVSFYMIVHAHLDSLKQRGFPMITAAHDEGDSLRNGHAADFSPVGQFKSSLHGSRGSKGDAVRHGQIRHAAFPGQYGTVGHERHQFFLL